MFSRIITLTLILLTTCILKAQQPCGFDQVHQSFLESDPLYQEKISEQNKRIKQYLKAQEGNVKNNVTYTIPVVVHVLYADENANHNISDEQIYSGIQRLNEIYNNADGTGVDADIEFCLAVRDPSCQPTTGINRVDGSVVTDYATEGIDIETVNTDGKGANRLDVLSLSRWNPQNYLNIWVVNEISDNNGGYGVQAFATFPGTNLSYDGIVILFNAFGYDYNNCSCLELKTYTDENEILAHEAGHYLSLYHTFEGDNYGNTCPPTGDQEGDLIADTPAHIRTITCPTGDNNCYPSGDPFSPFDEVVHNYMGYSPETCQHEFTQGQADRMRATLETSRNTLLYSLGCQPVNTVEPIAYCAPQTTAGLQGEYGMGTILAQVGPLMASSGTAYQDGGYLDNWCNNASLEPSTTYDIDIYTYGFYNEDISVYIDYNNDGTMSVNELIFSSLNNSHHTGTFTTPADAVTDAPLRLRILSDHYQFTIDGPCYEPIYGQVEDYTVTFPENDITRGNALFLDGAGSYLETDVHPDVVSEFFTIEFWCKPAGDPSQFQILFDKTEDDFSSLVFMGTWYGRVFVYFGQELLAVNSNALLSPGEWKHIAYVWDGTCQTLYLDGMLAGCDTVHTVIANNQNFTIGSFFNNFLHFNGEIDELRIWDEPRSPRQIREHMHLTGLQGQNPSPAYFQFNLTNTSNIYNDRNGIYLANLIGNNMQVPSSVNVASDGVSYSILQIVDPGTYHFTDTNASLHFTEKEAVNDFTVTNQFGEPNSTVGIVAQEVFDQHFWTISQSSDQVFKADITFKFDPDTFTILNNNAYRLYHRSGASDGSWTLLVDGASSITSSSVRFSDITQTGQFIIARN